MGAEEIIQEAIRKARQEDTVTDEARTLAEIRNILVVIAAALLERL